MPGAGADSLRDGCAQEAPCRWDLEAEVRLGPRGRQTCHRADQPPARSRSHAARGGSRARGHRVEEREGLLGSVYRGRLAILPLDRGLLQEAAVTQPASPSLSLTTVLYSTECHLFTVRNTVVDRADVHGPAVKRGGDR